MNTIKVLKHGIKVNGEYIKCGYTIGNFTIESGIPQDTITIYARGRGVLPIELNPKNETDFQTDYFCDDRANVYSNHPLYQDFLTQIKRKAA